MFAFPPALTAGNSSDEVTGGLTGRQFLVQSLQKKVSATKTSASSAVVLAFVPEPWRATILFATAGRSRRSGTFQKLSQFAHL